MVQVSSMTFCITLWISLGLVYRATMTTQEPVFSPLPTNLKLHVYPGIVNVTWDCNVTKSMAEHTFQIEFPQAIKEKVNISECFHEHFISDELNFLIREGFEVNISSSSQCEVITAKPEGAFGVDFPQQTDGVRQAISPVAQNVLSHGSASFCPISVTLLQGKHNTAADNLQCNVYNVSIVNCSWTVGREAPEDTQYSLAFRQTPHKNQVANPKENRFYEPCRDYRTDSFGRQVGCVLKASKIHFNVTIYVQLVGSSSETAIQLFDTNMKLEHFVILDPPRNIQLNFSSTEIEITWDTPETYSNVESHCFKYSVNINGDIKDDLKKQSYTASRLSMNVKVKVSLRAKWESFCSRNTNWSRWSDPVVKYPDSTSFTADHLLVILGIITSVVLFLLIYLCHRFQIWKRLFPKIPEPAKKVFEITEQKEILFLEQNTTKKFLPEEDEDCICLQVTEIPQKEQPNTHQYVNVMTY